MKRTMSPTLARFWAGSASASVMADYAAGRVVTVPAPSAAEQAKTADALSQSLAHWSALRARDADIAERYPCGSYDSDCYPDGDE